MSADARCRRVSLVSTAIWSQGTWLLFLPFFPVRAKTAVVMSIETFVLLLAAIILVLLGYLLSFHIYLRTCLPSPRPHWPVFAPLCSQVSRVRRPLPTLSPSCPPPGSLPSTSSKPKEQTSTVRGSWASSTLRPGENTRAGKAVG